MNLFPHISKIITVTRASFSSGHVRKWNVLKLHHVAIATPQVDTAANFYRDVLGTNVSTLLYVEKLAHTLKLGNFERNSS